MFQDVGDRLVGDEVHGLGDIGREIEVGVDVDRDRDRRPTDDGRQGGVDAAVLEDRRMEPAAELAQLTDRALDLLASAADQLLGGFGVGVDVVGRHPEVEADRNELLLDAVVKVALDSASLARHRVEDVLALDREVGDPPFGGCEPIDAEEPGVDLGLQASRPDRNPWDRSGSDDHQRERKQVERPEPCPAEDAVTEHHLDDERQREAPESEQQEREHDVDGDEADLTPPNRVGECPRDRSRSDPPDRHDGTRFDLVTERTKRADARVR